MCGAPHLQWPVDCTQHILRARVLVFGVFPQDELDPWSILKIYVVVSFEESVVLLHPRILLVPLPTGSPPWLGPGTLAVSSGTCGVLHTCCGLPTAPNTFLGPEC